MIGAMSKQNHEGSPIVVETGDGARYSILPGGAVRAEVAGEDETYEPSTMTAALLAPVVRNAWRLARQVRDLNSAVERLSALVDPDSGDGAGPAPRGVGQ